ncbi:MAG: DALR anticodon-binding domain-containing protein, partial [Solobacterium sp.]|nr:DALR anticodon-binding domain-containing protein [Solobacterium sp.]
PENLELSNQRLALSKATQITIKNALDLLGVSAPEKMERTED